MFDQNIDKILSEYLINVLDIKIPWSGITTLKEKDIQRRKLHDKLVTKLKLDDREIISKCAEAAYRQYIKTPTLQNAKYAFYHEFNVLLGKNPLTPEQEADITECYNLLLNTENPDKPKQKYDKIKQKFFKYCDTVRIEYYKNLYKNYITDFEKKSADELFELLKTIPDKYKKLYLQMDKRISEWFDWEYSMNYDIGTGIGMTFYDMRWYFCAGDFYHDYRKRVSVVIDGIKKWKADKAQIEWAINTIAKFFVWFNGVEEYLNTPYEKLVKIFLSFNDEETTNDKD